MKAVAINGSPRIGGNTEAMLKRVLAPLDAAGWQTELIQIGGTPIRGCLACYLCTERKDRQCAIQGDGLNDILKKIYEADAVILGSPTYFTDVSAEMKALIDRAGFVAGANGGLLRGKIGAAVVAVRRGGATHAYDTLNHLFLKSSMIVPGSLYWNLGKGLDRGEVADDMEAMLNMKHLGQAIAWIGDVAAKATAPYPGMPELDK